MKRQHKRWLQYIAAGISVMLLLCRQSVQADSVIPNTGYIGQEDIQAESVYGTDAESALLSAGISRVSYRTERLPAIRNQGVYGTCWAISILSLLEINLMQKGYTEADFSDMHLAYYSYYSALDSLGGLAGDDYYFRGAGRSFLNYGGNFTMALNALSDWLGAADEALVPYSEEVGGQIIASGLPGEYAFQDVAYLQNYYAVDMGSPLEVKQAIVEYGAVAISYYSDMSMTDSRYYNGRTAGYYCDFALSQNHGVVIVGWDDNYDAADFVTPPPGNGAWIVRNSWGEEFGEEGYFYLSYYDSTINSTAIAVEAVGCGTYDHNYQYDGAIYSTVLTDEEDADFVKAANVFTAHGNIGGGEEIRAVSFDAAHSCCRYEIRIYTNLTETDNPESGSLAAHMEGTTAFVGQYTVELPQLVYVEEGASFSVVLELHDAGGNGTGIKAEQAKAYSYILSNASAESGQSYLYRSGSGTWLDYGKEYNANIRIKAFTSDASRVQDGLVLDADGVWRYYRAGVADLYYVGLAQNENGWWYVENGSVNFGYTGLACDPYVGWWYVENGAINFGYTGLIPNENGWWYVENGGINFGYTGLACDPYVGWWYVENGAINFGYTGLIPNENGWWYVENGGINFGYTGLACDPYVGWWYVENGAINFGYTGLIPNENGWWYVENGGINFGYTGLACDPYVGWWYVENGAINFGYTGLIPNENGWWYVENGGINFGYTGLACDPYVGWWYVENGAINFGYTGFVPNENGWWYVENGMVNFSYTE